MACELSKKQKIFVGEYLVDRNATRTAIAAGYSAQTASQQASRLLTNSKIAAAINEKTTQWLEGLEVTAERTLREIAAIAYYDPANLFEPDGSVKQVKDMDPVTRRAIVGVEVTELFEGTGDQKRVSGIRTKFKLADKGLNLERLAKFQGLLPKKAEASRKVTLEDLVCACNEYPARFVS
jgi:phage terminase small subunit